MSFMMGAPSIDVWRFSLHVHCPPSGSPEVSRADREHPRYQVLKRHHGRRGGASGEVRGVCVHAQREEVRPGRVEGWSGQEGAFLVVGEDPSRHPAALLTPAWLAISAGSGGQNLTAMCTRAHRRA
jgi:hypothetical protein